MILKCQTDFPSGPCVALINSDGLVVEVLQKTNSNHPDYPARHAAFTDELKEKQKIIEAQHGRVLSGSIEYIDGICSFKVSKRGPKQPFTPNYTVRK